MENVTPDHIIGGTLSWTNLDRTEVQAVFEYRKPGSTALIPVDVTFRLDRGETGLLLPQIELYRRAIACHEAQHRE